MRLLAIDTATNAVGCALWDGGPVASCMVVAARRHAEVLMPAIDEMFRRAGMTVGDIDAVAVDVGPGLFSGLRVGLATAAAVAAARGVPSVGVPSLEALAHAQRRRRGLVAAIVDARRGEVYWSLYSSDGSTLQQLGAPGLAAPGDVAAQLAEVVDRGAAAPGVLAVGDGARRYGEQIAGPGIEIAGSADMWPSPVAVAELGSGLLASGAGPPVGLLAPLYLREADVRIGWDQLDGRVGPPGHQPPGHQPPGHQPPGHQPATSLGARSAAVRARLGT